MDRKSVLAFIAIYSFAASTALVFGETEEPDVTLVVADQPAPQVARYESNAAVLAAVQQGDGEVSDIIQLPMIIVRPEAIDQEAAEEP